MKKLYDADQLSSFSPSYNPAWGRTGQEIYGTFWDSGLWASSGLHEVEGTGHDLGLKCILQTHLPYVLCCLLSLPV